jgi:hypothetical protein
MRREYLVESMKSDECATCRSRMGLGVALGAGIGAAIGAAIEDVASGMGIGIPVGVALGAILNRYCRGTSDEVSAQETTDA